MCLLEGRMHERLHCVGALTSGTSRDTVMGYHICHTMPSSTFVHLQV